MDYNVNVKWECDFKKYLKQNPEIYTRLSQDYLMHYNLINCRDSIFGGRSEVFCNFYAAQSNEKIRYLDFTSLYPYVNKYCNYPV